MSDSNPRNVGLDLVCTRLEEIWGYKVEVATVTKVLGSYCYAGCARPLLSSVAELKVNGQRAWIPAPLEPGDPAKGLAPLYLHADRTLVMPTIRLFARTPPTGKRKIADADWPVEYLTLADWLQDALTRWRFWFHRTKCPVTTLEWLSKHPPTDSGDLQQQLRVVARVTGFALFGSQGYDYAADRETKLVTPLCPMWLRPAGESEFAKEVASRLVVTAIFLPKGNKPAVRLQKVRKRRAAFIPKAAIQGEKYRIRPAAVYDWGLDPVHHPEANQIRLTGRLGLNVGIQGRRLIAASNAGPQLSISTSRLPFAGYNDPRRLLMAANMQVQAVPVIGSELPLIRQDETGGEPPGVNLRVAYLAWEGWNHEDAWVISESAARRMDVIQERVQVISIGSVELIPELLIKEGQAIERGDLLLKRYAVPLILTNSLKILGKLDTSEEEVQIHPTREDYAVVAGTVIRIECWDLRSGEGMDRDRQIAPSLGGFYRMVYRVHIQRKLSLAVGDKLANRHGHKGIVGAIVPDEEMPRWKGAPLEALIDPISVLNRSNWGQVYESLAGAIAQESVQLRPAAALECLQSLERSGLRPHGRSTIEPPARSQWLSSEVQGVAGIQFVMRLPHHACDKLLISPTDPRKSGARPQRLGEMDQWALWGHAAIESQHQDRRKLSPPADSLRRLLATAGYDLRVSDDAILVERLDLGGEPPAGAVQLRLQRPSSNVSESDKTEGAAKDTVESLSRGALADAYGYLDNVQAKNPTVLVFEPPVRGVWLFGTSSKGKQRKDTTVDEDLPKPIDIHWLPIVPRDDRPKPPPHSDIDRITAGFRAIVRRFRSTYNLSGAGSSEDPNTFQLRKAVYALMKDAYAFALGTSSTGLRGSKAGMLRQQVLGRRVRPSVRAVISPAGNPALALDEIGVPENVARMLMGSPASQAKGSPADAESTWIWMKRDPVLHRWGLVSVKMRVIPGNTVRLPASLLGPMGADFDGDTVVLFGSLPDIHNGEDLAGARPCALAWDNSCRRPMYVPAKQYIYGLHLLAQDTVLLLRLQVALRRADAPAWPEGCSVNDAMSQWTRAASERPDITGRWWALLEEHAIAALARDPGMGLGLMSVDELAKLPLVACGAAKPIDKDDREVRSALEQILSGNSLDPFKRPFIKPANAPAEPIARVLVEGRLSVAKFGGALRRLLYSAASPLEVSTVRRAQTMTERVTQSALSVKAGKGPIAFKEYNHILCEILDGRRPGSDSVAPEMQTIFDKLGDAGDKIAEAMALPAPAWQKWLREPHRLAKLLARSDTPMLRLPLDDLRVRPFLSDAQE